MNDLVFAGVVVAGKLGVKSSQSQYKDNKPWWKRRLEDQINELRKDLSRIEQMDRGAIKSRSKGVQESKKRRNNTRLAGKTSLRPIPEMYRRSGE